MTKSISVRRREQRERQKAYRDQQRQLRRPGRDDIARAWLWRTLHAATAKSDQRRELDRIQDAIIETLIDQGFDERQSERALDDLLTRYKLTSSAPFRIKRHLQKQGTDLA